MMALSTPRRADQGWKKVIETRKRLEKCWAEDIDWNLYPECIKTVSQINSSYYIRLLEILYVHRDVLRSEKH